MEHERRDFPIEEFRVERRDDNTPVLRGHAAVFNTLSLDLGGFREQIAPGAFSEALKSDDIRALFNHEPNMILGRNTAGTLRLAEDERGLAIEIDPPDTQAGRDVVVSVERGDVTQMSFGFSVRPEGQDWAEGDDGEAIRTLTNVRLFDVSPVVFPAYPETDIAARELRAWKAAKRTGFAALRMRRRQLDLIEIEF